MKMAPVSADLLIKLGIAVAVVAVGYLLVKRSTRALQDIADMPARALKNLQAGIRAGGAAWQSQTMPDTAHDTNPYAPKYQGPLVNDDGYDFGNLSG